MVTKNDPTYSNKVWTFHENKEVDTVQPVQVNIYQSNTFGKDLGWLHFNNIPRVKEMQQV